MALEWRDVERHGHWWARQADCGPTTAYLWQRGEGERWGVELLGKLELEEINVGHTETVDMEDAQQEAEALLREWWRELGRALPPEPCPDCGRKVPVTCRAEHTMKGGPPLCHASHSETWEVWMLLRELGQEEAADAVLNEGVERAREWLKGQGLDFRPLTEAEEAWVAEVAQAEKGGKDEPY